MTVSNLDLQRKRWLSRALCRRYAVVAFSTFSIPPARRNPGERRTICWAFGSLIKGETEVLGAWNLDAESAIPTAVFGDLYNRGVEFLRCGLGSLEGLEPAFLATFRNAALYPSIEQAFASAIGAVKPRHRAAMSNLLRASGGDLVEAAAPVFLPGSSSEDLRQKYPGIVTQWDEAVAGCQPLLALPEPYRQLVRSVDQAARGVQERLVRSIQRHGPFVDSAEAFDFVVDALWRADARLERDAQAEEPAGLGLGSGGLASMAGRAVGTPALAGRVLP